MAKYKLDSKEQALLNFLDSNYDYDTTYNFDTGMVHVFDLQENTESDWHIANWIYGYYDDYLNKLHYDSNNSVLKSLLREISDLLDSMHIHFANDKEKMVDFYQLSKEEFLSSYSYLTELEYDLTVEYLKNQTI